MNRPKKKIELRSEKWEILYKVKGYNDAICDYEAWLKEVASVDNIRKHLLSNWDMEGGAALDIANTVSESIIGK